MSGRTWAPWVRWTAAAVFIGFGVGKFTAHASETHSFRHYGLPSPSAFAYAIGALELVGGALLAAGALTRLAALLLAGDMAGAIIVAGIREGEVLPSLTVAPVLLVALLFLVVVGAGAHSIDERLASARR